MKKLTTAEFIIRAVEVHGDKYDYSLVEYKSLKTKIIIKCDCGNIFEQQPATHIGIKKAGCTPCGYKKATNAQIRPLNGVIKEANIIHNNKYDYSLITDYKGLKIKVDIICPIHGLFKQPLSWHIIGKNGCPHCGGNIRLTIEEFISRSNKIHGDKYDYTKVSYINEKTKVIIICNIHGEFNQLPRAHSKLGHGCPKCAKDLSESKGERTIREFLEFNDIKYEQEKKFSFSGNYRYDFYINSLNLVIEYDGKQHFQPVDFFGGLKSFRITYHNDWIKEELIRKNNVNIIRIKYTDNVSNRLKEIK